MTERVGDHSMSASYTYDNMGRSSTINYPEGFGIKYRYDETTGDLVEILTNEDGITPKSIWKLNEVNSHGQITRYEYGNGLETVLGYDENQFLRSITTGTVQNLTYTFDAQNFVLQNRTGIIAGTTESFTYDNMYQLESISTNNKPELNLSMTYSSDVKGRMQSKSDIGTFDYTGTRPHAITRVNNVNAAYTPSDQTIHYTSFGKVSDITQGNTKVEFIYGPDHQRKTMEVFQNNVLQRKVYYFANYERHEEAGNVRHLYYIYSPTGLTAIYKKENSSAGQMLYVHKDHLGSIHVITDQNKAVQARYYYNAWGVKQNLDKAVGNTFQTTNNLPWLHRGYTGHEHLTEINLINMNGRVYDADLGMFISPDPQLQAPDNPVNFNRYAYALNNPLMYTDPTGEFFFIVPSISFSSGGVDVSLSIGVGLSDVISAQVTVGYSFGNDNLYGTVGVAACGASIYAGYGTESGWMSGVSYGLGFNYGDVSVSSNVTSIGLNFSENGGFGANVSAINYNQYAGYSFNPSISISPFPEQTTNFVRGKGFNSNNQVLSNFVEADNYKGALHYFGFKGSYVDEEGVSSFYSNTKDPSKYGIRYRKGSFESFETLYSSYLKESFHLKRYEKGSFDLGNTGVFGIDRWPEERQGIIHQYKTRYLHGDDANYLKSIGNAEYQINSFNKYGDYNPKYQYQPYTSKWWHFIYKNSRKW